MGNNDNKIKTYQEVALEIVKQQGTIKRADLVTQVKNNSRFHDKEPNINSIKVAIYNLPNAFPNEVQRISRGIIGTVSDFRDSDQGSQDENTENNQNSIDDATGTKEESFYQPFSEFLVSSLEECVHAFPIGNMRGNGRWGNPDVIGVNRPLSSHAASFPYEIVCAEIKIDPREFVTAFGQVVSYRLFCHRTYLVIPPPPNDKGDADKLEDQCASLGVGLIYFDPKIPEPVFERKTHARAFVPDSYYLNQFADALKRYDPEIYNNIFPR